MISRLCLIAISLLTTAHTVDAAVKTVSKKSSSIEEIQTAAEFDAILKNAKGQKPVVLKIYATWCGPCKQIRPRFESLAAENPDIKFVEIESASPGADGSSASRAARARTASGAA